MGAFGDDEESKAFVSFSNDFNNMVEKKRPSKLGLNEAPMGGKRSSNTVFDTQNINFLTCTED